MDGTPDRKIPIARPDLGDAEVEAARRAILSGWVTQGPEVAAFESEFAAYVGAAHGCAVSSCTAALHLALLGAGVQPGDEVITVSHSFIATANAVRQCGARPIFVDIDPETYNIDPARVTEAVTERTRCILCVHQMGMPCDVTAILKIAAQHDLPLVEDAACAIGSEIEIDGRWERIGAPHGTVACFSFHPRKVLTTGDGGMLTTNDPELDRKFRLWRQHGMSVSDQTRHHSPKIVFETYEVPGFNYRMTDILAAVGRAQLQRLSDLVAERRRLARLYSEVLAPVEFVVPPSEPAWARSNWQSYPVRLAKKSSQRSLMQSLLDRGVATRRGIMCAHRSPAYAGQQLRHSLPNSEEAEDGVVLLPLFPGMGEDDIRYVADRLNEASSTLR